MYWSYIIFFVFVVMVPEIVTHEYGTISEDQVESLLIFMVGVVGFSFFLGTHQALKSSYKRETESERETYKAVRELNSSYSYIGEVNRKMDLLGEVMIAVPTVIVGGLEMTDEKKWKSIMDAVEVLTHTNHFSLRFVSGKEIKTLKEIQRVQNKDCTINDQELREKMYSTVIETQDGYTVFQSPSLKESLRAYIMVKKIYHRTTDENQIMKALCAQALLLYIISYRNNLTQSPKKRIR
ncbi:MAG: hypothetical protein KC736_01125 [Candidatus Moranbacteria bacterium]|nr:hypothetical protein [Candidatus Moranbacteria bacterium]